METEDGGRTGLASLAAGVGFAIALCSWVFFALSATTTNGVGMWINDTETKLAAYVKDEFQFADLIMVFAGAAMLKGIRKVENDKVEEMVPFAIAVAGTAFGGNLVGGVAFGTAAYVLIRLFGGSRKELRVSMVVLAVILCAYIIFTMISGGSFVVAKNMFMGMPFGGPMGGPMGGPPM